MSDYADAARDLLSKLWAQFFSSDWWADNLLNYVVFTVLVTLVVWLTQRAREARKRRDYERWSLQILGYNDRAQSLYWEEVQRFLLSRFELWKFVKSVVSGTMIVTLRNADKAEEAGWLKIDYERRQIVVDFAAVPPDHVAQWQQPPPEGALAAGLYRPRSGETRRAASL